MTEQVRKLRLQHREQLHGNCVRQLFQPMPSSFPFPGLFVGKSPKILDEDAGTKMWTEMAMIRETDPWSIMN